MDTVKIKAPVIEEVSLSKLKPWDRNPRTDHAVEKLRRSIESFGYVAPIIVQKGSYRIIAGHGRYEAIRSMGVKRVSVIVVDMDDQRADIYAVADNKLGEFSSWDMRELARLMKEWNAANLDLELTGFGPDELHRMLSEVSEPKATEFATEFIPTGSPGSSVPPPVSQGVPKSATDPEKCLRLFLSADVHSEFMGMLERVAAKCGTSNISDTCLAALRREDGDAS